MKVAVITPYHQPSTPYLKKCLESVDKQTYRDLLHITIGDGCYAKITESFKKVHNISLPNNLNNYGDSPRSIGVIYAFSLGVDAVAFLDSDNWYAENHIETLISAHKKTGAYVVASKRNLCHLNGTVMGECPESDGVIFCDTNCLLLTRDLSEEAAAWWLIPQNMHIIDDRVIWDTVIHATDKIVTTNQASVYYRTSFEFHYAMFKHTTPEGTKKGSGIAELGDIIDGLQKRAIARAKLRRT
jgi:glycosyltransferase involved in cell wall biosynthesis